MKLKHLQVHLCVYIMSSTFPRKPCYMVNAVEQNVFSCYFTNTQRRCICTTKFLKGCINNQQPKREEWRNSAEAFCSFVDMGSGLHYNLYMQMHQTTFLSHVALLMYRSGISINSIYIGYDRCIIRLYIIYQQPEQQRANVNKNYAVEGTASTKMCKVINQSS